MVPGEHDLDLRQGMQGQQPRLPVQAHIAGNQDIIIPPGAQHAEPAIVARQAGDRPEDLKLALTQVQRPVLL